VPASYPLQPSTAFPTPCTINPSAYIDAEREPKPSFNMKIFSACSVLLMTVLCGLQAGVGAGKSFPISLTYRLQR
jgi:hypothetical protein